MGIFIESVRRSMAALGGLPRMGFNIRIKYFRSSIFLLTSSIYYGYNKNRKLGADGLGISLGVRDKRTSPKHKKDL